MSKNSEKLPLLKAQMRKPLRIDTQQGYLQQLGRSNTEPLNDLLKSMHRDSSDVIKRNSIDQLEDYKSRILRRSREGSPSKAQRSEHSPLHGYQLIQYRKSIKKLIDIFEEKNTQLKKLKEYCYRLPSSKGKDASMFNDCIVKQVQQTKKNRSKLLQFKKKLRKSLLKTEGNESPSPGRKNQTDLKKVLCIKTPYYEEKLSHIKEQKQIISYPHVYHYRKDQSLPLKQELKQLCNRSKRTTLGGWNFDKNETTYIS